MLSHIVKGFPSKDQSSGERVEKPNQETKNRDAQSSPFREEYRAQTLRIEIED
ncbi:MAG: hypothetical protein QXO94_06935 [Candidatus Bathyarchaeia archaeon]